MLLPVRPRGAGEGTGSCREESGKSGREGNLAPTLNALNANDLSRYPELTYLVGGGLDEKHPHAGLSTQRAQHRQCRRLLVLLRPKPPEVRDQALGGVACRRRQMTTARVSTSNCEFPPFGTRSVQLSERKRGTLLPKRHQIKHLDFVAS
jgi:hypothetical protein